MYVGKSLCQASLFVVIFFLHHFDNVLSKVSRYIGPTGYPAWEDNVHQG